MLKIIVILIFFVALHHPSNAQNQSSTELVAIFPINTWVEKLEKINALMKTNKLNSRADFVNFFSTKKKWIDKDQIIFKDCFGPVPEKKSIISKLQQTVYN